MTDSPQNCSAESASERAKAIVDEAWRQTCAGPGEFDDYAVPLIAAALIPTVAQAVGVRLATIEECAKIAEYNGWERTAEQIRALASQPSPAATVEVSKEIPADMRLIVSALKGRFFGCGGHMREMSENEAFDIALALRRAKEDHEWCSAATGDEPDSRLPLQYEDGPDYCTVKDAQGRDFALTMQPELMRAMEQAKAANKPAIDPKKIAAIDDFLADGQRDKGYRAFAMMRHIWPQLRELALASSADETLHRLPFHDETMAGLASLTIRKEIQK